MKLIIIITLILALISCNNEKKSVLRDTRNVKNEFIISNDDINKYKIEFINIAKVTLASSIKLSGRVELNPNDKIDVHTTYPGFVKNIKVMEGDKVNKGDVLFDIKNSDLIGLKRNFIEMNNNLTQIEIEYKRQTELIKNKAVSEKEYIIIEKEYKNIKNNLNALRNEVSYLGFNPDVLLKDNNLGYKLSIKAEKNGYIGQVNINDGKFIDKNFLALEIFNVEEPIIEVMAPSNYIHSISNNQLCKIIFNEDEIDGKITRISKVVRESSNMFQIQIAFKNKDIVPTGSFVEVSLNINSQSVFGIPINSIFSIENNPYIFIMNDNVIKKFYVKIGKSDNNFVEVLNHFEIQNSKIISKANEKFFNKIQ